MVHIFRAARVVQRARMNVDERAVSGRILKAPVWLKALERLPPSEILTRPKPIPHHDTHPRMRKPRNIYKPQRIIHPEDELRRTFFSDHPWELARPRIAVELDGKDAQYVDWSRGLEQPSVQVTGESVVQRQLWLMENHRHRQEVRNPETQEVEVHETAITKDEAYDITRKEFYQIRRQEQITRRIAIEEARMVGGYFSISKQEQVMRTENYWYNRWRRWAERKVSEDQAERGSAYANYGQEDSEAEAGGETDADADEAAELALARQQLASEVRL